MAIAVIPACSVGSWAGVSVDSHAVLGTLLLAGIVVDTAGLALCLRAIKAGAEKGWPGVTTYGMLVTGTLGARPRVEPCSRAA